MHNITKIIWHNPATDITEEVFIIHQPGDGKYEVPVSKNEQALAVINSIEKAVGPVDTTIVISSDKLSMDVMKASLEEHKVHSIGIKNPSGLTVEQLVVNYLAVIHTMCSTTMMGVLNYANKGRFDAMRNEAQVAFGLNPGQKDEFAAMWKRDYADVTAEFIDPLIEKIKNAPPAVRGTRRIIEF